MWKTVYYTVFLLGTPYWAFKGVTLVFNQQWEWAVYYLLAAACGLFILITDWKRSAHS